MLTTAMNIVVTLALLLFLLPVMILVAVAVYAQDGGPILFAHRRIGWNGRVFHCLKFRSMAVDAEQRLANLLAVDPAARAEWALDHKLRRDPRVTPLGVFLRKSSLDELPQLFNVLRGDMSLVGPRPPLAEEVALYAADDSRRMLVKPGMTGLWQVSGRSDLSWDESVRLDLRYVDNWSMTLDLLILWKTVRAVAYGAGAY